MYDHTPVVSVVENESVCEVKVCSPGLGVRLVPAIDVVTGLDVSLVTAVPAMVGVAEKLGVTVNV